jgi:hypothetical protein
MCLYDGSDEAVAWLVPVFKALGGGDDAIGAVVKARRGGDDAKGLVACRQGSQRRRRCEKGSTTAQRRLLLGLVWCSRQGSQGRRRCDGLLLGLYDGSVEEAVASLGLVSLSPSREGRLISSNDSVKS